LSELRALQRRVAAMDSELRKATKEIKRLNKKLANLGEQDGEEAQERETNGNQSEYGRNIEDMVRQAWS